MLTLIASIFVAGIVIVTVWIAEALLDLAHTGEEMITLRKTTSRPLGRRNIAKVVDIRSRQRAARKAKL